MYVHGMARTMCSFYLLRYTFSDLLNKEIPKLRNSIQDQSSDELTVSSVGLYNEKDSSRCVHIILQDFLANVREKSIFIGEVAMHQVTSGCLYILLPLDNLLCRLHGSGTLNYLETLTPF